MKKTEKYRVRECAGKFTIEIRGYEERGMLWWKRKEWMWYRTNMWGGVQQVYPVVQPASESFETLEAAQARIDEWKMPPTFHYDEG